MINKEIFFLLSGVPHTAEITLCSKILAKSNRIRKYFSLNHEEEKNRGRKSRNTLPLKLAAFGDCTTLVKPFNFLHLHNQIVLFEPHNNVPLDLTNVKTTHDGLVLFGPHNNVPLDLADVKTTHDGLSNPGNSS